MFHLLHKHAGFLVLWLQKVKNLKTYAWNRLISGSDVSGFRTFRALILENDTKWDS